MEKKGFESMILMENYKKVKQEIKNVKSLIELKYR
jgi:hypothetical protein